MEYNLCFVCQIFSYVSVGDLGRCARVCRSWKVLIQANVLWSKVILTLNKIEELGGKLC